MAPKQETSQDGPNLQDLVIRLDKLEDRQRGHRIVQDTLLTEQQDMKRKVKEIHYCLIGDKYTQQTNGGLVNVVNDMGDNIDGLEKEVDKLKTWKTRIVAAGSVISALFTFLAALIISQWHHVKDIIK